MQFPLINVHLFCKYFVRLSVCNATKSFATYGCFHPCLYFKSVSLNPCIICSRIVLFKKTNLVDNQIIRSHCSRIAPNQWFNYQIIPSTKNVTPPLPHLPLLASCCLNPTHFYYLGVINKLTDFKNKK